MLVRFLSLTYLPHVFLVERFSSSARLFATYEHDVFIYDFWNASSSPCPSLYVRTACSDAKDSIGA